MYSLIFSGSTLLILVKFLGELGLIFHVNQLPADDSHKISSLIAFLRQQQNFKCPLKQNLLGLERFNSNSFGKN